MAGKLKPSKIARSSDDARSTRAWLAALILIGATAIAYLPAWNGQPIWDDNGHITAPALRSWHGLKEIWLQPGATQQYYPVTHTVFWIEHKLWGDTVVPYHLVNLLLHGYSAILLWRILLRLKIPAAFFAAALFALHPVQVESVAWISELKNTLSGLFALSAAFIYLKFDDLRTRQLYLASLGLFLLGLLSKTAVAPLGAALIVVIWWKRETFSWKRDLLPLLPFIALGLLSGVVTAWVERTFIGAHGVAFNLSLAQRCLIAGRDFWFYLYKLILPCRLIFIYPRWQISAADWRPYIFLALLCALLVILWRAGRRGRGALAAFLVFLLMLSPALGFVNVYPFLYSFVADHFQYLACIGPLTLLAVGLNRGLQKFQIGPAPDLVILLILAGTTFKQSQQYRDVETLWRTTIYKNPGAWMAQSNLGYYLLNNGQSDEAVDQFKKVIALRPDEADGYNNLGRALLEKGRLAEGTADFQKALDLSPNDADAHNNLGGVFLQSGDTDKAIGHFERALFERPGLAQTETNLGNAFLMKGEIDKALEHYRRTLKLPGDHAESHCNIGKALRRSGRIDEAIAEYREALTIQPDYADAHNNLANALRQKGELAEAAAEYEEAFRVDPHSVLVANNLAWLLATCADASVRNGAKAVQVAEVANGLTGRRDPIILHTLAAAYAEMGQFDRAMQTAQEALALAEAAGPAGLADSLRNELELYQTRRPLHEPAH